MTGSELQQWRQRADRQQADHQPAPGTGERRQGDRFGNQSQSKRESPAFRPQRGYRG